MLVRHTLQSGCRLQPICDTAQASRVIRARRWQVASTGFAEYTSIRASTIKGWLPGETEHGGAFTAVKKATSETTGLNTSTDALIKGRMISIHAAQSTSPRHRARSGHTRLGGGVVGACVGVPKVTVVVALVGAYEATEAVNEEVAMVGEVGEMLVGCTVLRWRVPQATSRATKNAIVVEAGVRPGPRVAAARRPASQTLQKLTGSFRIRNKRSAEKYGQHRSPVLKRASDRARSRLGHASIDAGEEK